MSKKKSQAGNMALRACNTYTGICVMIFSNIRFLLFIWNITRARFAYDKLTLEVFAGSRKENLLTRKREKGPKN